MCHAHLYELTAARTNWTPDVCGGHPVRDVTVTRAKLIISDQRDVPEKMSERSRGNEGKVSEFGSFARVLLNKSGPSSSDALCAFSSSKIKTCNTGTFVRLCWQGLHSPRALWEDVLAIEQVHSGCSRLRSQTRRQTQQNKQHVA